MDEITYRTGMSQSRGSALVNNGALTPASLSGADFQTTFSGVYSNEIVREEADEARAASVEASTASGEVGADGLSAVATALFEYLEKTPVELYFEQILEEKGLTTAQYEALPLKERAELHQEIMEEVRERMKEDAQREQAGLSY